jgi:quercetin dioxygenase-like cupin family protein
MASHSPPENETFKSGDNFPIHYYAASQLIFRRSPVKTIHAVFAVFIAAFIGVAISQEAMAPAHIMTSPGEITWGDPPPVFEKGASFAVIAGDPGQSGIYVVRLKMPAGYVIAPHWHPTDEHVTVISGTLALGMGDKLDKASMKSLPAGSYALLPAEMHHYAMAKTDAIVQVHGAGPFALTYVNPADDPSTRTVAE